MIYNLPGTSVYRNSSGKNTGVGCHAFLQGILHENNDYEYELLLYMKISQEYLSQELNKSLFTTNQSVFLRIYKPF